ncbi:hypothetical protein FJZ31_05795 [Candidatus Poribacteria bacterium]|nr:hypothetical protein [Candidatus Poribacteria bacterium]
MTQNNLVTVYVYDSDLRERANLKHENYWYEYIREINEQLGLRAVPVSRQILKDVARLNEISILFIGDLTSNEITEVMAENLRVWGKNGGVLIGFATQGLDNVFGNRCAGMRQQPTDDYTIAGYFDLLPGPLTAGIHSELSPEQKLLIFSDSRQITPQTSQAISRLYDANGADTGFAAITQQDCGKGHAYYFGFNVPKTIWILHQGRPVTDDLDNDGKYRARELHVIGDNARDVLYADDILFLIQNMVGKKPQPFIYQIPPKGSAISDALFYWGGDDESAKNGIQLRASEWMKEKGLPYHINAMGVNGEFGLTVEYAEKIRQNGHEISLHYNFVNYENYQEPYPFTEEDVKKQAEAFYQKFGFRQICSVNHSGCWIDWEKPAEWMLAAGGNADNSFIPGIDPLPAPQTNAPFFGFGFGTSYPFYFYDDFDGKNARINFLEEPVTAYEIGHRGSIGDRETSDFEQIHTVIDLTAKYHLLMNLFFHPVYISDFSLCRAAIAECLRYIEERNIIAVHFGNDALWKWWDARSRSTVTNVMTPENTIRFITHCEYEDGMILKIPLQDAIIASARCDGKEAIYKVRQEFGQNWGYVIAPYGNHEIEVKREV